MQISPNSIQVEKDNLRPLILDNLSSRVSLYT